MATPLGGTPPTSKGGNNTLSDVITDDRRKLLTSAKRVGQLGDATRAGRVAKGIGSLDNLVTFANIARKVVTKGK